MPTSPPGTVEVSGFVKTQGKVPWTEGMTIADCIQKARGFAVLANRKDVNVIEPIQRGGQVRMRRRFVRLDSNEAASFKLRDGSIILVNDRMPTF